MNKRNWTAGERRKFSNNMRHFGGNIMTGYVVTRIVVMLMAIIGMGALAHAITGGDHSGLSLAFAAPVLVPAEIKEHIDTGIKGLTEKLADFADKAKKEMATVGAESKETKEKIDKTLADIGDMQAAIKGIETELSKSKAHAEGGEVKSFGQRVIESEQYKELAARGFRKGDRMTIELPGKSAIINATGQNQPLVPADRRPGIVVANMEQPTIRGLLSSIPTSSNVIEFSTEDSFTNNAQPQGAGTSPNVRENTIKGESTLTFGMTFQPVQTMAHFFNVSKQALADAPQLQGHIETRGRYGLAIKVEEQLLEGDGVGSNLKGLLTWATSYNTGLDEVGDSIIDKLRRAMVQLRLKNHRTGVFVLNPIDWALIETLKETGSGASGRYIYGDPHGLAAQSIWRVPVVDTQSIDEGDFLAIDNGPDVCQIFDREQASVSISLEHDTNFTKNMATILLEERLALVTYKPYGIVTGSF